MSIAEKLQTIAENEQRVYEAGKAYGETVGKKAEWNEFWDNLQDNGKKTNYNYAFMYWTDTMFSPKYDIKPATANMTFGACRITNLKQRLMDCGVVLDLSGSTSISETFAYSQTLTHIPTVDCKSAPNARYLFANDQYLVEIEKIVLKEDGSQDIIDMFSNCYRLERVAIEGVIGIGNIMAGNSIYLNHDSIVSIINALSPTASGQTTTLSKAAVNKAFETSIGANDGTTSQEWLALVGTKSNWTISLV